MEFDLIPRGTRVIQNGEGEPREITANHTRTFLCTLEILEQIEQESLDVSIWCSADGTAWESKPLLKMPQRFYRGTTRQILDLTLHPDVKFLRARWELTRWGRVAPTPMFVIGFRLEEVPAFVRENVVQKISAAG